MPFILPFAYGDRQVEWSKYVCLNSSYALTKGMRNVKIIAIIWSVALATKTLLTFKATLV